MAAPGGADAEMEHRLLGAQGPQLAEQAVFRHLDLLHPLDIQGPRPGDLDGGYGAVEEFHAQLALQLVDIVGEGGLGDKGLFSRPGEVALLCQGQYIVEFIQAHTAVTLSLFASLYLLLYGLSTLSGHTDGAKVCLWNHIELVWPDLL